MEKNCENFYLAYYPVRVPRTFTTLTSDAKDEKKSSIQGTCRVISYWWWLAAAAACTQDKFHSNEKALSCARPLHSLLLFILRTNHASHGPLFCPRRCVREPNQAALNGQCGLRSEFRGSSRAASVLSTLSMYNMECKRHTRVRKLNARIHQC